MKFEKNVYKQELAKINDTKVIRHQETPPRQTPQLKTTPLEELNNSIARLKYCQEHYEELINKYGKKIVDSLIEKTEIEVQINKLMNSLNEPKIISTTKDVKRR